MVTVNGCSPQQGLWRPSAPVKPGPEGGEEDRHGIMEKAGIGDGTNYPSRRRGDRGESPKQRPGGLVFRPAAPLLAELCLLAELGVVIAHGCAQGGPLVLASLAEVNTTTQSLLMRMLALAAPSRLGRRHDT